MGGWGARPPTPGCSDGLKYSNLMNYILIDKKPPVFATRELEVFDLWANMWFSDVKIVESRNLGKNRKNVIKQIQITHYFTILSKEYA